MNTIHNVLSPLAALTLTGLLVAAPQNPLTEKKQDPLRAGVQAFQKEDFAKAHRLLSPLADRGDAKAQGLVAQMRESGKGTDRDLKSALRLYTASAEQKVATSSERLGRLFLRGKGVEKDLDRAVQCFRRGAMLGDGQSMFDLGYCYGTGLGVDIDLIEAGAWYDLAGSFGVEQARENLEVLKEQIAEADLDKVEAMSDRWESQIREGRVVDSQLPAVPVADWLAAERAEPVRKKSSKRKQIDPFGEDDDASVFDLEEEDTDSNDDPFTGEFEGLMVKTDDRGNTQDFPMNLKFDRRNGRLVAKFESNCTLPGPEGKPVNGVIRGTIETAAPKAGETKVVFQCDDLALEVPSLSHTEKLPPQELRVQAKGGVLECAMGSESKPFTSFTMKRVGAKDEERDEPKRPTEELFKGTVREMLETGEFLEYDVNITVRPIAGKAGQASLRMKGVIEYPVQNGKLHVEFDSTFEGAYAPEKVDMDATKIDVRIRETGQKVPFKSMTLDGTVQDGSLRARFGSPDTGFSQLEARSVGSETRR